MQRIEPYAPNEINRLNGHSETKSSSGNASVLSENTAKARLSVSQNPDPLQKETKSLGRLSVSQDSDPVKEGKHLACMYPFTFHKHQTFVCLNYLFDPSVSEPPVSDSVLMPMLAHLLFYGLFEATGSAPSTPQRISLNSGPKTVSGSLTTVPIATAQKRSSLRSHSTSNVPIINKSDIIPVVVPRSSGRSEPVAEPRKEDGVFGRMMPLSLQSKAADLHNFPIRDEVDKPHIPPVSESAASMGGQLSTVADKNFFPTAVSSTQGIPNSEKALNYASSGTDKHEINSLTAECSQHEIHTYFTLLF